MQPKSIAAVGVIFVILALFVVLVILAAISKLTQLGSKLFRFGQHLGGTSSRAYSRAE